MNYTRRDFGKLALAGIPAARAFAAIDSKFDGVQIGAITYSFRDIKDLNAMIGMMVKIGLGEVELMYTDAERDAGSPHAPVDPVVPPVPAGSPKPSLTAAQIEATRTANAGLRKWRLSVPMDKFAQVRRKFDTAGIDVRILCFNMNEAITDEEIDYAFNMAKALGAKAISTSTQVTVSKRIAPFADKHGMMIGFHGHDATWDPNEFSTPESFAKAMSYSKYNGVNLDIGHFTAANYDAVAYIKEHHARITNLHLKDRKKNHGANVPWGRGTRQSRKFFNCSRRQNIRSRRISNMNTGIPGWTP